jgi:hypothetical protein
MEMFDIVVLEGLFLHDSDKGLTCTQGGEVRVVADVLRPLVGKQVQLAVHYMIPDKPDPDKPGYGCCVGNCDAHRKNPHFMYSLHGEGLLIEPEPGCFALRSFGGTTRAIPAAVLHAHHVRILAAPIVVVGKMRDSLEGAGAQQLDALGIKAEQLKGVLQQVRKLTGKVEG